MSEAKISIIVPVYNVETYLPQCLNSLVEQTYKNLEIICVNDGSTDGSLAILRDYAERDGRIKIVSQENAGLSGARNTGISYVTGQYLMFVDSDDWLDPDTCSTALQKAEELRADVVFWNYVREYENASKERIIFGTSERTVSGKEELSALHRRFVGLYGSELRAPETADSVVTAWGKLYRSDLIVKNDIRFVDTKEIGTEDALFNLYVFGYVNRAAYIPNCFCHYRRDNETSLTKTYKAQLRERWLKLYEYMRDYLAENDLDPSFKTALNNRICLNVIPLGLNILRSGESMRFEIGKLKEIVLSPVYRDAVKTLELRYFPIHWKVFFFYAKYRMCRCLLLMLLCIKKLK